MSTPFIAAMDATTKLGVNGATVLTEQGVGDPRVTLFTMLNRGLDASYVKKSMREIMAQGEEGRRDAWLLTFQTRAVRGGKGERALFTACFVALATLDEETAIRMLPLVPEYGCWRDLWALYEGSTALQKGILDLVRQQYLKDLRHYRLEESSSMSLLAKWLPRERANPRMAAVMARTLFPEESRRRRLILYRTMISAMNRELVTVETLQCAQRWGDIDPKRVPGRAFTLYRSALLNLPTDGKGSGKRFGCALRHPDNVDRMACREHVLGFLEQVKAGKAVMHGADVVYPHQLIQQAKHHSRDSEALEIVQAQWNAIRAKVQETGGLGRTVVMCDFSGSMSGVPLDVSLAMGILISEVTHVAFRNRILAFDAEPHWHAFQDGASLYNKMRSAERVGQGLNTNFWKAAQCIIQAMVAGRVPVGEEPSDLIVVTDMGFDEAAYQRGTSADWGGQLAAIQRAFVEEGEKLWGRAWKAPRIVIWNVRAEYNDFHATAVQEGVVQLSGWSPSILKALQTGVTVQTPYEGLRAALDDPMYDRVRAVLQSA